MRLDWGFAILAVALACAPGESRVDAGRRAARGRATREPSRVCASPTRGLVVGRDTVAGFSTRATLGTLRRQCGLGEAGIYDAVGWQALSWTFPFAGAHVTAVESQHGEGDTLRDDEVPDLWVAEGDSLRLPDGELVPRTLGILRARYGVIVVDESTPTDDVDGVRARSCRFPYLLFALSVADTARKVPDSARCNTGRHGHVTSRYRVPAILYHTAAS
jgi:hypothetical protein